LTLAGSIAPSVVQRIGKPPRSAEPRGLQFTALARRFGEGALTDFPDALY
jgi:hypothetical protein